ncbi:stress-response A/B barrel domain-containing protein UP3 [Eutrema salsugineum]|nr:stress-response A/B barrel domain-containing protein UP3 [Eutrema salsugineum]
MVVIGNKLLPPSGSVVKIIFLKLKESIPDEAKSEILDLIKGLDEKFPGIGQITVGENFSPAQAKGFSIALIAFFKDLAELESVDSHTKLVNSQKEKVRDCLDSTIVVEFLVPSG